MICFVFFFTACNIMIVYRDNVSWNPTFPVHNSWYLLFLSPQSIQDTDIQKRQQKKKHGFYKQEKQDMANSVRALNKTNNANRKCYFRTSSQYITKWHMTVFWLSMSFLIYGIILSLTALWNIWETIQG